MEEDLVPELPTLDCCVSIYSTVNSSMEGHQHCGFHGLWGSGVREGSIYGVSVPLVVSRCFSRDCSSILFCIWLLSFLRY